MVVFDAVSQSIFMTILFICFGWQKRRESFYMVY